jgi:hypothetical protein
MNKERIRYWLDFIPVIILLIYSVQLIYVLTTSPIRIEWNNITGLLILPVLLYLLFKKHKIGVLLTGLVLLLAIFGAVSFTEGISTWGGGLGKKDSAFSFELYGKPVFILYFILHAILSGRYYTGILTRKFWMDLKSETPK